MQRFDDSQSRFHEFLKLRQTMKFSWGKHDCLTFACDGVGIQTGVDIMANWRGQYSTARGAYYLLRQEANGSIARALTNAFGEPRKYALTAQRGDVVLAIINKRETAGLVDDTGWQVAFPGLEHLVRLPLNNQMLAWRV